MFGTSIPINFLKTYAAIFYVDRLGLTTPQWALDPLHLHLHRRPRQPHLRLPLRPHPQQVGPAQALAGHWHPLLVLGLIVFYTTPVPGGAALFAYAMLIVHLHRHPRLGHQRQLRRPLPRLFPMTPAAPRPTPCARPSSWSP